MPEQEVQQDIKESNPGPVRDGQEKAHAWKYGTALDLTALLAISALCTIILIRDLPIRLCDIISDECLVAHSKFYLNPELFSKDFEFQSWARVALSSMLNWLPALCCQITGMKPETLFAPALLLQNSLIVCATYLFGRKVTEGITDSRLIALVAAAFTMLWHPQWWNSALIYNLDWMPYSNWMALAFLLLSFAFSLENRKWVANFLIVIGTLIHPILGGLASALTSFYRIWDAEKEKRTKTIIEAALTTGVTASLIFIPIHFSTAGLEFAPDTDRLSVLAMNIHATPWGNHYPYGISSFIASLIFAALFSAVALLPCPGKTKDNRGQRFIACAAILAFSALAVHGLSAILKIAAVQNLIISRSTILLLAACIPMVIWQVWTILKNGSIIAALTVFTFFFAASPVSLLALTMIVIAQRLRDSSKSVKFSLALQCLATGISVIVLCYHTALKESVLRVFLEPALGPLLPQMISQNRSIAFDWRLFIIALSTFFIARVLMSNKAPLKTAAPTVQDPRQRQQHSRLSWSLCLVIVTTLSIATCVENRKRAKPDIDKTRLYYEAQLWVRDNTRADANFILVNPTLTSAWRTFTGRPVVTYREITQVYCSTTQLVEFNKRLKQFKKLHPPLALKDKGEAEDFTTPDWIAFAKEFGADYMVRRKDWPSLQLPLVYQNQEFVIYKLQAQ